MGTTVTFPDGSVSTSSALTPNQVETAFQQATAYMLGLLVNPLILSGTLTIGNIQIPVPSVVSLYQGLSISGTGIPANTTIIAIGPGNQIVVSQAPTANGVVSLTVADLNIWFNVRIGWQLEGQPGPPVSIDTVTLYSSTVDTEFSRMHSTVYPPPGAVFQQTDVFTRAWRIHWTFYGPNATSKARTVVSSLIKVPFIDSLLAASNLYINPDIKEPERVPENFQAEWWERVDMDVDVNEQVTETLTIGVVQSVEVKVYTKDGLQTDFTVPA